MTFSISPANFFVNAPFDQLQDTLLDLFIRHGLQPEIGLEGNTLYKTKRREFQQVADQLKKNNLSCTIHAPFFDLAPGALDPHILQASRNKLHLAFDLIPIFTPKVVVCHLNYESCKHSTKQKVWFQHAKETWLQLLEIAESHQTMLVLENTYEKSPEQHMLMLDTLNSPLAKFCFDTGHVLAFANNRWQDWQEILDHRLGHIHLHDNFGDNDSHLAIGKGTFDFQGLFDQINQDNLTPTVTIEPHSLEDLWESLKALKTMGFLQQH